MNTFSLGSPIKNRSFNVFLREMQWYGQRKAHCESCVGRVCPFFLSALCLLAGIHSMGKKTALHALGNNVTSSE